MAGRAATAVALVVPAVLFAQSQPKFPETLPVPKTAQAQPTPAPEAPAKPGAAEAPAPPAGGAPGRRDPFDPLVRKTAPGDDKKVQEIAALRLVGVMWDPKAPDAIRALVETPDGLGYYLRLNEERFGGKVTAVERDRVQFSVREDIPGGESRTRTIDLRLARSEGQQ
jgi:hypothetical protein